MAKAQDVDSSQYGLFFALAGHATLWDYPAAKFLQLVAKEIYSKGGVVAAVCHGSAILPHVIDQKTKKSIIDGKKVTGFTTEGEEILNLMYAIKKANMVTIEDGADQAGTKYIAPPLPFADFTQVDGRVVTGTNPASARSTAVDSVKVFDQL